MGRRPRPPPPGGRGQERIVIITTLTVTSRYCGELTGAGGGSGPAGPIDEGTAAAVTCGGDQPARKSLTRGVPLPPAGHFLVAYELRAITAGRKGARRRRGGSPGPVRTIYAAGVVRDRRLIVGGRPAWRVSRPARLGKLRFALASRASCSGHPITES